MRHPKDTLTVFGHGTRLVTYTSYPAEGDTAPVLMELQDVLAEPLCFIRSSRILLGGCGQVGVGETF